jgi:DNA-binding CsgD family transcriptional regulator
MEEMDLLKAVFANGDIGVCIKQRSTEVVWENQAILNLCGYRCGQVCSDNCMEHFKPRSEATCEIGTQYFHNVMMGGQYFDIVFIVNKEYHVTMVYPLAERHQAEINHFGKSELTAREMEIVEHIVSGKVNQEIADQLGIAKTTLKAHINNIYHKLPPEEAKALKDRSKYSKTS